MSALWVKIFKNRHLGKTGQLYSWGQNLKKKERWKSCDYEFSENVNLKEHIKPVHLKKIFH